MIKVTTKLQGFEGFKALLDALPEETRFKALIPSAREMGRTTLGYAIELSPYRTGALRRNIRMLRKKTDGPWMQVYGLRVKTARRKTKRLGFLEGTLPGEKKAEAKGSDDPYYWFFQEFGTAHMDAHPFLRPALEGHQMEHIENFRASFWNRLIVLVKRLHRAQARAARKAAG